MTSNGSVIRGRSPHRALGGEGDERDLVQEIRFAVVMYGGVSLAIYMNGVAQELLALTRSTTSRAAWPTGPGDSPPGAHGTERVYRELGQYLGRDDGLFEADDLARSPVRTRFVIDVLAGTSAGGINAVFLAKAMANAQDLSEIKRLWVTEAELDLLIDDGRHVDEVGDLRGKPTASLLSSQRMYWKLLSALDGMRSKAPEAAPAATTGPTAAAPSVRPSPYSDEIDLFVTATDLAGLPQRLPIDGQSILEERYRKVFSFRYRHYLGGEQKEPLNELAGVYDPMLAFASRCTSSFPVAFPPFSLKDIDEVLDRHPKFRDRPERARADLWRPFFSEYLAASPSRASAADAAPPYLNRWFADGGYLDNKPFDCAIAALERRRPELASRRFLLYVEPAPEHPEEKEANPPRPTALENLGLVFTLPQQQAIRDDLGRLKDRNRRLARARRMTEHLDSDRQLAAMTDRAALAGPTRGRNMPSADWKDQDLSLGIKQRGLAYAGYHRLKVSSLTDRLAAMLCAAVDLRATETYEAVRALLHAWRADTYVAFHEDGPDKPTENEFLTVYDLAFRLRRLALVLEKVALLRTPNASNVLKDAKLDGTVLPDSPAFVEAVALVDQRLREIYRALRDTERALTLEGNLHPLHEQLTAFLRAAAGPDAFPSWTEVLAPIASGTTTAAQESAAAEVLGRHRPEVTAILSQLASYLKSKLMNAAAAVAATLAPDAEGLSAEAVAVRRFAHFFYAVFEDHDMVTFPALHVLDPGEQDQVEIVRISPDDVRELCDGATVGASKLAGSKLGHFGAFLHPLWRKRDIMWGRLDAAEILIRTLLPEEPARARMLMQRAFEAIVAEEIGDGDRQTLTRALANAMIASVPDDADAATRDAALAAMVSGLGEELKQSPAKFAVALERAIDPAALLALVKSRPAPEPIPGDKVVRLVARSVDALGKVLEDGGRETRPDTAATTNERGGKLARRSFRLGLWGLRQFWSLVELAAPRSFGAAFLRHAAALAYLLGVICALAGSLTSTTALGNLGFVLLGGTLVLQAAVSTTRMVLAGEREAGQLIAVSLLAVVLLLLLLVGARHIGPELEALRCHLPDWGPLRGDACLEVRRAF